jgi:hypothetical protein
MNSSASCFIEDPNWWLNQVVVPAILTVIIGAPVGAVVGYFVGIKTGIRTGIATGHDLMFKQTIAVTAAMTVSYANIRDLKTFAEVRSRVLDAFMMQTAQPLVLAALGFNNAGNQVNQIIVSLKKEIDASIADLAEGEKFERMKAERKFYVICKGDAADIG